jgi:hypothetical protein
MCINTIATAFNSISSIMSGVGAAMSVAGAIQQGNAQAAAAQAQAEYAEYNAKVAQAQAEAQAKMYEFQADVAEEKSKAAHVSSREEARLARIRSNLVKGSQRAAFGAAGLDPNAGSALDILLDTAWATEQDIASIRYNSLMDQWGYGKDVEVANYNAQLARSMGNTALEQGKLLSSQYLAAGENAKTAGMISGVTSGATYLGSLGGSSFSSKWDWMSKPTTGTGVPVNIDTSYLDNYTPPKLRT